MLYALSKVCPGISNLYKNTTKYFCSLSNIQTTIVHVYKEHIWVPNLNIMIFKEPQEKGFGFYTTLSAYELLHKPKGSEIATLTVPLELAEKLKYLFVEKDLFQARYDKAKTKKGVAIDDSIKKDYFKSIQNLQKMHTQFCQLVFSSSAKKICA